MPEEIFVSFVIIAYNEAANISRALKSITALDELGKYEIIVVNDGSRDNTGEIVKSIAADDHSVRLIDLAENCGRGYARRLGVGAACGDLIATVDADIVLPRDWLTRARAALNDHAAVAGTAVPDGDVAYIYKRFRLTPRLVNHTTRVTGSNALYRRDVFDIATFDPALREGEDSALNHTLGRRGLSFATVPGLIVRHEESKTLGTSLKWLFEVGQGATRQLFTYRQVRQPDVATVAFIGSAAIGLVSATRGRPFTGATIPLCFVLAASVQHVRSRFETPQSQWPRVASAVAVDSAMLTAYFAGRLVGVARLGRVRRDKEVALCK